ncbi:unnamed protein product [Spirodela intermedia]|uniref:Uncharacterized protein n=1 Tax=Spirodela intermedia TaxID=51605 RepID=A0A7I8L7M1_SPIIN|nr:unnamed protein product [Spirodela intermedia]
MAPASRRRRRRSPPRWRAMTRSMEPTSFPPMKTAGTGGPRPTSLASARCISRPCGSWSKEGLHGVAQAAGTDAEDHHRLLRCQPHHPIHGEIDIFPF